MMLNCELLTDEYLGTFTVPEIRTMKKITYLNIESGFDIETTSTFCGDGKFAFMYIWMFGLGKDNPIFYGRTWEEFTAICEVLQDKYRLSDDRRLIVYVHNLGFEFQFMKHHFKWLQVFALNKGTPVKALCSYGIEFRCSMKLSGSALATVAKNLPKGYECKKMVGDLDYSLVRHHETQMTEQELGYCENDIQIILNYISSQMEIYQNITKIPLTNTGRVRDKMRKQFYQSDKSQNKSSRGKYFRNRAIMEDLTLTPDDYRQLKRTFMGGFTHSNPYYTDVLLENVNSYDLTSSYPSVMCAEEYPMSRSRPLDIKTEEDLNGFKDTHCVMFRVKFTGLRNVKKFESYISESKCLRCVGGEYVNGRVFSADELIIDIVDIDVRIIKWVYEWDSVEFSHVKGFVKGYLPKDIIIGILDMYEKKTTLKDVEGKEVEYLLEKGMLNSAYGMCVTDPVKDEHTFTDEWEHEPANVDDKIDKYNTSKNRFLYYAWGIWVTAYARRNLWSAIMNIGSDYIYADTDSVKFLNHEKHKPYFDKYNRLVTSKLYAMCDALSLDPSLLSPKTIKGIKKPMGVWDFEGTYDWFKTLGAKRYLIKQGDNYQLTVAGLSKRNGMDYIIEQCENDPLRIFNRFSHDLFIPADRTGKMTHTNVETAGEYMITDYDGVQSRVISESGMHLEPASFNLTMSEDYLEFLTNLEQGYVYNGEDYAL